MPDKKRTHGLLDFMGAIFSGRSRRTVDDEIKSLLLNIENLTGKRFKNHHLVKKALTHKSSKIADEHNNYERMEFLGDAVLGLIVSDMLYAFYKDEDEGKLTYYKDSLIQMRSLAGKARELGLGEYVIVGSKEKRNGFSNSDTLLGDIFESLIGAIYLDMGFDGVFKFIKKLFENDIQHIREQPVWDFKSKLNNIAQETYKVPPDYRVVSESMVNGTKVYRVAVGLNRKVIAHGEARNKKEAEQKAAMKALARLEQQDSRPR
ncbi:MAG: ribonuclease III [Deltaproteobacteria bacterium]|nr:ribonuclease III [Deltaproteobacteria bacterium]MCL5277812.1 ribonuclease III [Deltaproteobacteria bacterium]